MLLPPEIMYKSFHDIVYHASKVKLNVETCMAKYDLLCRITQEYDCYVTMQD